MGIGRKLDTMERETSSNGYRGIYLMDALSRSLKFETNGLNVPGNVREQMRRAFARTIIHNDLRYRGEAIICQRKEDEEFKYIECTMNIDGEEFTLSEPTSKKAS